MSWRDWFRRRPSGQNISSLQNPTLETLQSAFYAEFKRIHDSTRLDKRAQSMRIALVNTAQKTKNADDVMQGAGNAATELGLIQWPFSLREHTVGPAGPAPPGTTEEERGEVMISGTIENADHSPLGDITVFFAEQSDPLTQLTLHGQRVEPETFELVERTDIKPYPHAIFAFENAPTGRYVVTAVRVENNAPAAHVSSDELTITRTMSGTMTVHLVLPSAGRASPPAGGGTVVGTATDAQGNPLPSGSAKIYLVNAQEGIPDDTTPAEYETSVGPGGVFSFANVHAGSYYVAGTSTVYGYGAQVLPIWRRTQRPIVLGGKTPNASGVKIRFSGTQAPKVHIIMDKRVEAGTVSAQIELTGGTPPYKWEAFVKSKRGRDEEMVASGSEDARVIKFQVLPFEDVEDWQLIVRAQDTQATFKPAVFDFAVRRGERSMRTLHVYEKLTDESKPEPVQSAKIDLLGFKTEVYNGIMQVPLQTGVYRWAEDEAKLYDPKKVELVIEGPEADLVLTRMQVHVVVRVLDESGTPVVNALAEFGARREGDVNILDAGVTKEFGVSLSKPKGLDGVVIVTDWNGRFVQQVVNVPANTTTVTVQLKRVEPAAQPQPAAAPDAPKPTTPRKRRASKLMLSPAAKEYKGIYTQVDSNAQIVCTDVPSEFVGDLVGRHTLQFDVARTGGAGGDTVEFGLRVLCSKSTGEHRWLTTEELVSNHILFDRLQNATGPTAVSVDRNEESQYNGYSAYWTELVKVTSSVKTLRLEVGDPSFTTSLFERLGCESGSTLTFYVFARLYDNTNTPVLDENAVPVKARACIKVVLR